MNIALDNVHTVSFSLAFYNVLRPQGIRKQMKTLRKRHRVHMALIILFRKENYFNLLICSFNDFNSEGVKSFNILAENIKLGVS